MKSDQTSNAKRNMTGILFVIFGFLILFDNFDLLSPKISSIFLHWPMFLISLGLISLVGRNYVTASLLFFIGGFYILPRVIEFEISFNQLFWPVIVIFIGFIIIGQQWRTKKVNIINNTSLNEELIDEFSLFGGSNRAFQGRTFKGGHITCIFSGSNLDFGGIELGAEINVLDITCVVGNTKLIIPSNWRVKNELSNILGGISVKNNNRDSAEKNKTLIITGKVILGGVEIVYV